MQRVPQPEAHHQHMRLAVCEDGSQPGSDVGDFRGPQERDVRHGSAGVADGRQVFMGLHVDDREPDGPSDRVVEVASFAIPEDHHPRPLPQLSPSSVLGQEAEVAAESSRARPIIEAERTHLTRRHLVHLSGVPSPEAAGHGHGVRMPAGADLRDGKVVSAPQLPGLLICQRERRDPRARDGAEGREAVEVGRDVAGGGGGNSQGEDDEEEEDEAHDWSLLEELEAEVFHRVPVLLRAGPLEDAEDASSAGHGDQDKEAEPDEQDLNLSNEQEGDAVRDPEGREEQARVPEAGYLGVWKHNRPQRHGQPVRLAGQGEEEDGADEEVALGAAGDQLQESLGVGGQPDMMLQQVSLQSRLAEVMQDVAVPCPHVGGQVPEEDVAEHGDRSQEGVGVVVLELREGKNEAKPEYHERQRDSGNDQGDFSLRGSRKFCKLLEPHVGEGVVEGKDHAQERAPVIQSRPEIPLVQEPRRRSLAWRPAHERAEDKVEEPWSSIPDRKDDHCNHRQFDPHSPLRVVEVGADPHGQPCH
mmetsp:Transcript_38244/g.120428  ORF Transcript_38244/g.120428 Transcript_38244/m.120428 type:complete len:529 (-) Transcript_38244:737-2323(-)